MQPCIGGLGSCVPFPGLFLPTFHFSLSLTVFGFNDRADPPPSSSLIPVLNQLQVPLAQFIQTILFLKLTRIEPVLKFLHLLPEAFLRPVGRLCHPVLQMVYLEVSPVDQRIGTQSGQV